MATAELILEEARVRTLDAENPTAEAVAVGQGRLLAVGSTAEVRRLQGPGTRTLALEGRAVYPGFTDAHVHLMNGGRLLSQLDLREVRDKEAFRRRVAERVRELRPGAWLLGRNWDHERMAGRSLPQRSWLDDITPRNPLLLHRYDAHSAVANSLALELAGITDQTPSPPGGEIHRGSRGRPTGFLTDAAIDLVEREIPEPTPAELVEAARAGLRQAARWGLTGLHDMTQTPDRAALQSLHQAGQLPLRVWTISYPGYRSTEPQAVEIRRNLEAYRRLGLRPGHGDARLKLGAIKIFSDGALGPRTALLGQPYSDAPHTSGLELLPEADLFELVGQAHRWGIQLSIHAIGDLANHRVLNALERAQSETPGLRLRHRVEHAQILDPADLRRFGPLGIVASVQPSHAVTDMPFTEARVGPDRVWGAYAFRSLLDAGAVLALGTDWPIDELSPLKTLFAAVARAPLEGGEAWYGEQRLSLEEALTAYTRGPAYAAFQEGERGLIREGYLADLTVLSRDLLAIEPAGYLETEVELTVVGGEVVYQR